MSSTRWNTLAMRAWLAKTRLRCHPREVPPRPAGPVDQRAGTGDTHENHTPTGAFKVHGGIVYMDALRRTAGSINGVITATRGNHGQSIAFAAGRPAFQPPSSFLTAMRPTRTPPCAPSVELSRICS